MASACAYYVRASAHDTIAIPYISFATVNWIDVFIRNEYRQVVNESIRYCQKEKGLELYAWCIPA